MPAAASLLRAAVFVAFAVCAAAAAAQQPAPAPPGTTGPVPPPATQTPPEPAAPAQPGTQDPTQPPVQTPPLGRVIAGDAGIIFLPVKPERTADFEKIMAKLHDALALSSDPVKKQQAAGWKLFKAVEPGPNNTALYVFLIDPAVKGSDYAFWKTMYEAFPAEVQELYKLYTAASASGQTLVNLNLIRSFAETPQLAPKIPD